MWASPGVGQKLSPFSSNLCSEGRRGKSERLTTVVGTVHIGSLTLLQKSRTMSSRLLFVLRLFVNGSNSNGRGWRVVEVGVGGWEESESRESSRFPMICVLK